MKDKTKRPSKKDSKKENKKYPYHRKKVGIQLLLKQYIYIPTIPSIVTMDKSKQTPRQEAKHFVGDGSLRDVLKTNRLRELSDEAIQKIIDACSFVFKL